MVLHIYFNYIKDGKVMKWRVENSWGTDTGNKGYWAISAKNIFNI